MPACPRCGAEAGEAFRFCPFDGSPLAEETEGSLVGKVIAGRYQVVGRVGEGGMATIYLARHQALQRDVALKVLHPSIAAEPRNVQRFAREGRAASRIDHENVVYVLDFGQAEGGFYFLAMEHVVGRCLEEDIVRSGRVGSARVVHILAQVASALARAHELGVIHRDLKPDNVLLTHRGRDTDFVKVLDFGLARVVEPETDGRRLTRVGEIFGTPEYMAPEQWEGGPADARTDVYAFGVMAYQMLTGQMPFEGAPMKLWLAHCGDPMPRPSDTLAGAGVPEALDEMVLRCTAKNPAQRYASMREVLDALGRAWSAVEPPSASRTAATYAGTVAAPPAPPADAIPDVTAYRAADMDVLVDGPALVEEIRHLHDLRARRAAEVLEALFGRALPERARRLLDRIAVIEVEVRGTGEEVDLVRALVEEGRRVAEEERAHLRLEVMDASLILSGLTPLIEPSDADGGPEVGDDPTLMGPRPVMLGAPEAAEPSAAPFARSLAETLADGDAHVEQLLRGDAETARLHRAERRLAAFERSHLRETLELEHRLSQGLASLHEAEARLSPLYEELADLVADAAAARPDLRREVIAFEQVDGALLSYKALLDAIES